MNVRMLAGELNIPTALDKAITRKVDKIGKRLKRYHPDVAELEIRLSHQAKIDEYGCALVLKTFRDTLHADKAAPELRTAVDRSFDALLRELDTYRVKVNKSLQAHG